MRRRRGRAGTGQSEGWAGRKEDLVAVSPQRGNPRTRERCEPERPAAGAAVVPLLGKHAGPKIERPAQLATVFERETGAVPHRGSGKRRAGTVRDVHAADQRHAGSQRGGRRWALPPSRTARRRGSARTRVPARAPDQHLRPTPSRQGPDRSRGGAPPGAAPAGPRAARRKPTAHREVERRPAATPPGSGPTDTNVAPDASGTIMSESLPWRSPSGANSSPTTSTRPAADPALRQRPERPPRRIGLVRQPDLDVLRVRRDLRVSEARHPAQLPGRSQPLPRATRCPHERRRRSTAASRSGSRALGGSAHAGSGIRSIFRLFRRLETTRATSPRAPQPIDRQLGRTVQLGLLLRGCLAAVDEVDAGAVDFEHFRTAIEAKVEPTRAGRPRRQLTIHIADVGPADDDDVDGRCGEILDQRPHALRRPRGGRGRQCRPSRTRRPRSAGRGADAGPTQCGPSSIARPRLAGRTCVAAAA